MNTLILSNTPGAAMSYVYRSALLMLSIFAAGATTLHAQATPQPPHVVFFLVDDLGQRDVGCYGSSFYETPHLDRLAREGMQFTNAYAACPVCSPTRASILTGQWPQRTGITDYIGATKNPKQWKRNTRSLPATYHDRLEHSTTTIAEALATAGYRTFFAGKWHLGPEGHWPEDHGFEINRGGVAQGGPYTGRRYFSPYDNPRLSNGPEGEHLPARLAEETCAFLREHHGQPCFAYLSFYSVHTPLMARGDLEAKYRAKRAALGGSEAWGREEPRDVRLSQDHAIYAAMVEAMDEAVGKVLSTLDELGISENTLVIFTSDNGGLSTSEGWPTSNAPLRAGKGWMYEGGIREPLLMRWPKHIAAQSRCEEPVSSPDFFPTLLEVAGIKPAPDQILDGLSLVPLFQRQALPQRKLYWHYPHYGNQGGAPAAAIRMGRWKLIEWLEDGRMELFDLERDPGETQDLAARESERVHELADALHAWQVSIPVRGVTVNPNFDPERPSGRESRRPASDPQRK